MADEIICPDTSILIEYFRKKDKSKSFLSQLLNYSQHSISAVTEFEFNRGNKNIIKPQDLVLQKMVILPFDSQTSAIAVSLDHQLKLKRKRIDTADLFIAATAIQHNLLFATLNVSHFERIDGLRLIVTSK